MNAPSIDRRQWLALALGALVHPPFARAAQSEAANPSRFASGTVVTRGGKATGRLVVAPGEVEVFGEKRLRPFALHKIRTLALAPRSADPAHDPAHDLAHDMAHDMDERERELVELAARLAEDPRNARAIEAWLQLLRGGYTAPTLLGPPLAGDVWIVPDETRHHAAHAASAFALDLAVLGPRARVHERKGKNNEDYASWDAPLIAVADGQVARARDDLADDAPFQGVADPERANDLVLSFEGGLAFYQHLRRGSLRVKAGDRVQRGDELARVGNSGNASWPHLHFAVYERFEAGSLSVPIQVESYSLIGTRQQVGGRAKELSVACRNVPLQEGWVVHLGEA